MERRNFLALSLASAGAGILAPQVGLAGVKSSPYAGSVYYTKDAPGRWAKKATPHIPTIKAKRKGKDLKVQVTSPHPMDGYKHYIVKHVILDKNFNFIDEKVFDPTKDKAAISNFTLSASKYRGTLYALSLCNLHDNWLNMTTV